MPVHAPTRGHPFYTVFHIHVNCLHFIGCQNYTNVLINHVLYQIQFTALLLFFRSILITSALTAVKDHGIKDSETAFSNSNVNYFWSIKKSSEVIEKLRLRNFRGSQVYSFDFSTLYTSLPHDLIKAKVVSLATGVLTESQKRTSIHQLRQGFLSNKKYDSYKCWSCAELREAFTFLM